MKTTLLILLLSITTIYASSTYAQEASLKFRDSRVTVEEALHQIENQSEFYFLLNNRLIDVNREVKIDSDITKIEDALTTIFEGTGVKYKIIDRQIVLTPAKIDSRIAQDKRTVTGTVIDSDGTPLSNISIGVKGTTRGAFTDGEGSFTLTNIEATNELQFSFVGLKTVTVVVGEKSVINVTMELDAIGLDEVIAIGYGSAKKSDLSSSVATVTGLDKIGTRAIKNTQDFLQGNVAGVTVVQQGGDPSSDATITIRGMGSLSSEEPLWVVDGMPYYGGPLNPNDIESMSILKDAAAASIYGAQAASGVIVVTTKSGKSGKTKVNVDLYTGVSQASNLPTPLTAEEQSYAYNTAADNAGTTPISAHDATLNPFGAVTRTNWIDAIFRSAPFTNANVAFSGGSEKGRYSTSFNYQKKEGVLLSTEAERLGLRLKSEFDLSENIKVGENIYITRVEAVGANTSDSYAGVIMNAIWMPSSAPIYDSEGNYHGVAPEDSEFAGSYGDVYNPVALLERPTVSNPKTNINANIYFDWTVIPELKFRSSFSLDYYSDNYKKFTPMIPESGRKTEMNYLFQSWSERTKWIWDNQFTYSKQFNDHALDVTGVYSAQLTEYEYNSVSAQDFAREEEWYQYIGNAAEIPSWESSAHEDALTSLIGRARYNYKSKYYASASIRRDQTSRLSTDNNSELFSSFSAAWRLTEEEFMKDIEWLNTLKLRASWGQIGNIQSVDYYAYNVPMSSQKPYLGEDPSYIPGYYIEQQSNPDLKWETSETTDIGLDISMFNNKVEVVADYFTKTTLGMILTNDADPHSGTSNGPTSNVGDVTNKGFELGVTYRNMDSELKYEIGGNISSIKNNLENLDGYTNDYIYHESGASIRSSLFPYRSAPGEALYSYHLVPYLGKFKSQAEIDAHSKDGELIQPYAEVGDLKFEDTDDDGTISDSDRVFHGNSFPTLTYAVNLSANYKMFDLSMQIQGVSGSQIFNGYKYTAYNMAEQSYNRDNRVLEGEDINSDVPILKTTDNNQNFGTNSTWYLEDGSYLRLKNLTFGYTVPTDIMNRVIPGSSLRIYFSGENLFTVTEYSGMDPEVGGIGLDQGQYPISKTYTGGLSFSF